MLDSLGNRTGSIRCRRWCRRRHAGDLCSFTEKSGRYPNAETYPMSEYTFRAILHTKTPLATELVSFTQLQYRH